MNGKDRDDLCDQLLRDYKKILKNSNNRDKLYDSITWLEEHRDEINKIDDVLTSKQITSILRKEYLVDSLDKNLYYTCNPIDSKIYNDIDKKIDNEKKNSLEQLAKIIYEQE